MTTYGLYMENGGIHLLQFTEDEEVNDVTEDLLFPISFLIDCAAVLDMESWLAVNWLWIQDVIVSGTDSELECLYDTFYEGHVWQ